MVVGSALVIRVGAGPPVFGYSSLGVAGFLAAGILAIGLALGILRSGRL
jgi:ubiquinone biosynthesis protein